MEEKTLKVVSSTQQKHIGHIFTCDCIPTKKLDLPNVVGKPLKLISVLPNMDNPTHVKFQNPHITLICKII